MLFFYIILLSIALFGAKFKNFNQDYITVRQTNVIKGIFIWLVFMGHIMPYITKLQPFESAVDIFALDIVNSLMQLVVVPFMFYSGYGVMYSIKNKGKQYVSAIPQKRIAATMLNFGVAVTFFVILNLLLGIPMSIKQVLLSYIGWDWVGNSNWYIFTICFCYLSSYLSYKLCGYGKSMLIANTALLIAYIIVMSQFKGYWWYDTCLAYVAGGFFSYYKEDAEKYLRSRYKWALSGVVSAFFFSYVLTTHAPFAVYAFMNICSIMFSFLLLLITMKVQINSRVLEWSGKNLFPLYIYQRLPMILFSTLCGGILVTDYKYLYVLVCALFSIATAYIYKFININIK